MLGAAQACTLQPAGAGVTINQFHRGPAITVAAFQHQHLTVRSFRLYPSRGAGSGWRGTSSPHGHYKPARCRGAPAAGREGEEDGAVLAAAAHTFSLLGSSSFKCTINAEQILGPSAIWLSTSLPKLVFLTKPAQSRLRRRSSSALGWALGRIGLRGLSTTQLFHQMWGNRPKQIHALAVVHPQHPPAQRLPGKVSPRKGTPRTAASGEQLYQDKKSPGCPRSWQHAASTAGWLVVSTKSDDGFCFFGEGEGRRFNFRVLFSVLI